MADLIPSPWDSNIKYEVLKSNPTGESPVAGELVTIRFQGKYKDNIFDDTLSTEQPYFYRAGVGLILKGLDDTVLHMKQGEKYHIKFDGKYAFENGVKSAPGKPRIPPGAELDYIVELDNLPGRTEEFIADFE